jgi:hypothetical protein
MRGYSECLCLKVEDEYLDLLVGNLSSLYYYLISFLKRGPLTVRLLDNLDNLMLREVDMLAFIQTSYAICWLGQVIRAFLLFALIEDILSFVARAKLGARLRLPLSQLLIRCGHINYSSLYFI